MGDTLPLIPEKGSICADVRPIIRTVFREFDYLPALASKLPAPLVSDHLTDLLQGEHPDQWTEQYKAECEEIYACEGELKRQYAVRMSREPLPNIYQLCSQRAEAPPPCCRLAGGLLARRDLVPAIEQDAGRDGSLWIKNILNRSSCNMLPMEVVGRWAGQQPLRLKPYNDDATLQSLSVGAVRTREPLPLLSTSTVPPQPDYMLCLPPQIDFINFTIGHLHSQHLRLVNVSKFEIRISIRPPKRQELDVEITGPRGLCVTSGAAAELRVNFRPRDVRAVKDVLFIAVSMGRNFLVPIACYMQPPILDILIPSMTSPVQSGMLQLAGARSPPDSCDVLELGARLLGDVHCTRVLMNCDADHASFFMVSEDAWFSLSLDVSQCLTARGSVRSGPFVVWPAWWGGGGTVRGCAWCRAAAAGVTAAALRLLSSTAVVRTLHLLADTLLFRPDHLTIVAQEKDYDICGEGEEACEYYVHLGTAFPHRALSATVQLINHSPVVYSYYWSVRAWGVCSCLEDARGEGSLCGEEGSEELCVGAREARDLERNDPERYASRAESTRLVRVQPARGHVMPRSSSALHVQVPDVGARLGVQRAVLMLILKDIPTESFPPDYDPMIINTEKVPTDPIPGVHGSSREVCEVVCAQMEVWWDVVPVRFVLDPPSLLLNHSRRKESVMVDIKATQLFGCEGALVSWEAALHPPPLACLAPAHTCTARLSCPLPSLPNHFPETDVITMVADNEEWRSQCVITRQCATRHPALRPEGVWLGVVAPGTHMHTSFHILNDTHQRICWWAEAFRWLGENQPSPVCVGRVPCDTCHERACSCALLRPARGALPPAAHAALCYDVNAPECDGCVVTLVRVRRTEADVAAVHGAPATEARAALVAYRVLAPRLVLRVLPCGHGSQECSNCRLDEGALGSRRGTATLRPRRALLRGRRTCYRLHVSNTTPLPTALHFDREHDSADILKVKFSPNDIKVRPYGEVEIQVVLEARRVCGRRLFVYRARVDSAYRPVYLLIDTAIEGVKISCQVPLGSAPQPDSFVILTRMQKEQFPGEEDRPKPSTPEEVFAEEDAKREMVKANRCRCPFQMVYVPPPPPRPAPPRSPSLPEEQTPISILTAPPSLTRVCACANCCKPVLPELEQPLCLQFTSVPLRTVHTRTLRLRNESVVTAHWSAAVRRWPRGHSRSLDADRWARDVPAPGVALQCAPTRGVLAAHADTSLTVRVYADCWGCYRDQLLIQVEDVEPIVLDVWVEAVGAPLQLAIAPPAHLPPTMWTSTSDCERVLRATNVSRSPLTVHAYTAADYEYPQDALPFRLYLRYYDTPPRSCPCLAASELAGEGSEPSSIIEEVETGFEIYLAPDYGPQNDEHYTVAPEVATVRPGEAAEWRVALAAPAHDGERAPDVTLLLRLVPGEHQGPCWRRGEPPAQVVRLRQATRALRLQLSRRELRVRLCALHLPYGDVLRVRKRFHVQNVGSGVLELGMETVAPWSVVREGGAGGEEGAGEEAGEDGGCGCGARDAPRHSSAPLRLAPQSCTEVCVEVCVSAAQAWPAPPERCHAPAYAPHSVAATPLYIFDDDHIFKTVPLVLELEFPVVRATPPQLDFRVVVDGDTRKGYFSVSHSSRSVTLTLATQWIGGSEFKIWPPLLRIPPGGSANVYLQYTAIWQAAPVEGCVCVVVCCGEGACAGACGDECGGRGAWCRAVVAVHAAPTRDHKFHVTRHDHTDDPRLLPPDMLLRHAATGTSE